MPNLADYPKGFSPYKLQEPYKPPEVIVTEIEVFRQWDTINFSDIPECDYIRVSGEDVVCCNRSEVPNPNYKLGLQYYERQMEEYQLKLDIQNKYLPKWEAELAAEIEAQERATLAKLKAKYE